MVRIPKPCMRTLLLRLVPIRWPQIVTPYRSIEERWHDVCKQRTFSFSENLLVQTLQNILLLGVACRRRQGKASFWLLVHASMTSAAATILRSSSLQLSALWRLLSYRRRRWRCSATSLGVERHRSRSSREWDPVSIHRTALVTCSFDVSDVISFSLVQVVSDDWTNFHVSC